MKPLVTLILSLILLNYSIAQTAAGSDFLYWTANQKLTANDFQIKKASPQTSLSFAQFTIGYKVGGFDFLSRNFNNKVTNSLIRSASWLDTSVSVQQSLRYQQTLFDMAEVYARRMRQQMKLNRRKLAAGPAYLDELNSQIMADFAKRRLEYEEEITADMIETVQLRWEETIQKELAELSAFAASK